MEGRAQSMGVLGVASVFLGVASSSAEDVEALRPAYYKKWRNNPKVGRLRVVASRRKATTRTEYRLEGFRC